MVDIQVVLGAVFMAFIYLSLGQMWLIPTFLAGQEVFYKQRSTNFYHVSSYALATALSQVPMQVVEMIVFANKRADRTG